MRNGSSFPRIAACLSNVDNRLYPIVIPLTIHTATHADQRPLPSHHRDLRSRTGMRQTYLIISTHSFFGSPSARTKFLLERQKVSTPERGSQASTFGGNTLCSMINRRTKVAHYTEQHCGDQLGAKDICSDSSSVSE